MTPPWMVWDHAQGKPWSWTYSRTHAHQSARELNRVHSNRYATGSPARFTVYHLQEDSPVQPLQVEVPTPDTKGTGTPTPGSTP